MSTDADEVEAALGAVPRAAAGPAARTAVADGVAEGPRRPWAARTFAALGHRDYRLFFLGMAVSSVGTWGRHAAQAWLVSDLTPDRRWLAWSSAASLLGIALCSFPGGVLADRVNKRRLLFWVQVASLVLSTILTVLVATRTATPALVVALACGFGVVGGLEMPCRQGFVVEMVGRETLRNAIALNSLMFNLPLILGPALASVLADTLGPTSVFAFDALSYLAAIVAFAQIRAGAAPPPRAAARPVAELTAGFRYVAGDRATRTVLLLLAVAMVCGWSYTSLLAAYARDTLRTDAHGYNLLYLSSGVGACVGALVTASRRPGRPMRTIVGALAVFLVSYVGVAVARDLATAVVARTLAGAAMITFFATGSTSIQLSVPDAIRSRVMALWTFTFALALPVGQVILGELARTRSVPETYATGAVAMVVGVAAILVEAARRDLQRSRSTTYRASASSPAPSGSVASDVTAEASLARAR
ncbi:MAG: MFS transporter [Planctomycetia bacterium]|nr:MFS transporter [Planctomycetia bacterium]